jgi:hypothetical protein
MTPGRVRATTGGLSGRRVSSWHLPVPTWFPPAAEPRKRRVVRFGLLEPFPWSAPERIRTCDLRFRRPRLQGMDLALQSQTRRVTSPTNRQKFDSTVVSRRSHAGPTPGERRITVASASRGDAAAASGGAYARRVPRVAVLQRYAETLPRPCATQRCSVSGATSAPLGHVIVPSSRSSSTRAK